MPRMSIVIPVYNAERYLRACLASVLRQTMRDLEVICVDDGSTDDSPRILDECAARDDRLRVIHQRNAGAGAARNAGMDRATGDVLLCVDADDTLAPDACEVVPDSFARTGCEVMCFGFTCVPADRTPAAIANRLRPRDALIKGFHPEVLFTENVRPFSWRCALSREFCERVGARYDEALTLGDDQYFLFYVYPRARRILLCSRQLYAYRMTDASMMHAASASGASLAKKLSRHRDAVAAILSDWKSSGWQGVCAGRMLDWDVDLVLLDASALPEAEQTKFWSDYLGVLADYFGEERLRAAGGAAGAVLRDVRGRLSGSRAGACVRRGTVAAFYLRQRGLVNCVRRVVRSRF